MIDNLYLLANGWFGGSPETSKQVITSSVTNADLIASQNAQNFVFFSILGLAVVIVGGIFAYMFRVMTDGFKEAKQERIDGFKEAKLERIDGFKEAKQERKSLEGGQNDLRLRLARIEQLLIYTKATEQGVSPAQVEAEVAAAARRELGLDEEE